MALRSGAGSSSGQDRSRSPVHNRPPTAAELFATRIRDDIVQAVVDRQFVQLRLLVTKAFKLQVTLSSLEQSGLGILLADKSLWALTEDAAAMDLAHATASKWRAMYKTRTMDVKPLDDLLPGPGPKVAAPFAGCTARTFLERVLNLASNCLQTNRRLLRR